MLRLNINKIIQDYKTLKSSSKVAQIHNVSGPTIISILRKNNIDRVGTYSNDHKIPQALESYRGGMGITDISKIYGLTKYYFKKILKKHNIEYKNRNVAPPGSHREYIINQLPQILLEVKHAKYISHVAAKHNIPYIRLHEYLKINNHILPKLTKADDSIKDVVYDLYVNHKKDAAAISRELNVSVHHVFRILKKFYKSHMRSSSETARTKALTPEHQSKALAGMGKKSPFILPSGKLVKLQGYEDHFLNYVFKYSTLSEDDFQWTPRFRIKIADQNRGKYIHYYPDFFLPKYNLVIEIKSTYVFNMNIYLNKRKIRKTKEAGYKFLMIKDKKYSKFHKWLKENNLLKPIES